MTRTPSNTYRLQITETFDLFRAAEALPYLAELGVDWVYLSPLLAAEPGSDHGYDVVAHDHVDESRGGAAGLATFEQAAHELGMGILVDIVPNHVGVATPHEDPWWWDVLRHGRESAHAHAFDIEWAAGDGRIRIPVVGDDDQSEGAGPIAHLRLVETDDGGELAYHDQRFPIAPGTWLDGDDADTVHARQHYELVNWHVADDGLNYRRFFAVNTLAAVRVEVPDVFADSHVEIKRWFDEGLVDGLRVDHPDGLRDPGRYLEDLADLTGGAYVLVEKILETGESLPSGWATQGTTGYDALGVVDRVLTDPTGQPPLDALEARLRGAAVDWPALVHDSKRAVADGILASEVNRITREVRRVLPGRRLDEIADAVAELMACFPVYRSYLPEGRDHLDAALDAARRYRPDLSPVLDDLLPVLADPSAAPAQRFQQTTGMVMAKGVEDSAFYRWSRLTSLNEVGGDPSVFAVTPDDFHLWASERQRLWPTAMSAGSTHDTKRGEDVRARITAISELPGLWGRNLDDLFALLSPPDPGFANLLIQAVVGAWPARGADGALPDDFRARLHGYAEKAMREAGDRTTWTEPDAAYEAAVHALVDALLDDPAAHALVVELVEVLAAPGWSNGLSSKLLTLTLPGVPDVYQGSELWEQSLVDPDNRRPVDFAARAALLDVEPRLGTDPDDPGVAKLAVTRAALRLRRDRPELFDGYVALVADGPAAQHVIAFDRGGAISVVTRLPVGLAARGGWEGTELVLPAGDWFDQLGGRRFSGTVPVGDLLADLPVALLVREAAA
ncbi:(1-_4)-alpha-D-glucan 1-alpha-D-glucosylmutase [Marmoricola sp. OAE513]|uniref:malto-oligosyltrehalose synthase n=1 Tax=Marmoricola sp. OAE513 TaxID=2817894 RepID=UPI001AE981A4